jgi:hypothetical protein
LRLLTKEILNEGGPITKKDEEDLKMYFNMILPNPGIDRMTSEQLLDNYGSIEVSTEEDRSISRELVDRITLRHSAEELAGRLNDPECFEDQFVEMMLSRPDAKDVSTSDEEVAITAQYMINSDDRVKYNIEDIPYPFVEPIEADNAEAIIIAAAAVIEGVAHRKIRFQTYLSLKTFDEAKPTDQIGLIADRQVLYVTNESKSIRDVLDDHFDGESKQGDDTGETVLVIPVRIQEQSHRVTRSEARQKFNNLKRWERRGVLPSDESRTEEEKTMSIGPIAEVVAKLKDRKPLSEVLTQVAPEVAKQVTMALEGDRAMLDSKYYSMEEEHIGPYRRLIGRRYIDDENNLLYEVRDVRYNRKSKVVVAIRGLVDGRPVEGDDEEYVVSNELDSCIVKLVEKYAREHPLDATNIDIVSESMLLELQLLDEGFKDLRTLLQEQLPDDMGVLRVNTDILSRNHRKSDFVWGINSQAPAIRRLSKQIIKLKGITVTKEFSQVLIPECLVRTVLTQYHERWGHPAGARLLSNLDLRYWWMDIVSDAYSHAETCEVCQRKNRTNSRATKMFVYPRMISPFYTCHIDLAGPFPTTLKGNVWILVFKDALSK